MRRALSWALDHVGQLLGAALFVVLFLTAVIPWVFA